MVGINPPSGESTGRGVIEVRTYEVALECENCGERFEREFLRGYRAVLDHVVCPKCEVRGYTKRVPQEVSPPAPAPILVVPWSYPYPAPYVVWPNPMPWQLTTTWGATVEQANEGMEVVSS